MATTNILRNQTWNIGKAGRRCATCGGELASGAMCWAVLVEWPAGTPPPANPGDGGNNLTAAPYQRMDYCPLCWESGKRPEPPAEMFSWWKSIVPDIRKKRKPFVDDSVLLDLFDRLAGRHDIADIRFRFVLALLLMRKRLLKYEGTEPPDAQLQQALSQLLPQLELWKMTRRGGDATTVVVNPHLSAEQIGEVSQQISTILAEEI